MINAIDSEGIQGNGKKTPEGMSMVNQLTGDWPKRMYRSVLHPQSLNDCFSSYKAWIMFQGDLIDVIHGELISMAHIQARNRRFSRVAPFATGWLVMVFRGLSDGGYQYEIQACLDAVI